MDFKNSQTEKNMKSALTGESLARNKYTFYAMKAKQEGNLEIAELFEKMAQNEAAHAKIWFQYLNDGLGTSKKNLMEAASGEFSEWSSMYPNFAKQAKEEGFDDIAEMFNRVAEIEKDHEQRFMKMYAQTFNSQTSNSPKPNETTTVETMRDYRCMFCGASYKKRPDVCDVCGAIGSFDSY